MAEKWTNELKAAFVLGYLHAVSLQLARDEIASAANQAKPEDERMREIDERALASVYRAQLLSDIKRDVEDEKSLARAMQRIR